MPYKLEIQSTGSTPYVLIDEAKGYMQIKGVSFHENVMVFFKEISEWLANYLKSDFESLTFDCELTYFNSSTAKLLFNMLIKLDAVAAADKQITVNWITTSDNDIIIECGEDFRDEISHMQFNLIIQN